MSTWERRTTPPYQYGGNCERCAVVIKPNEDVWLRSNEQGRLAVCEPCAKHLGAPVETP